MRITAGFTKAVERRDFLGGLLVLAALFVAFPACSDGPETYVVGEGAGETAGYLRAFEQSGGADVGGEPAGPVRTWGFGCRQLLRRGRTNVGALMQHPCGRNEQVFAVTGDFWALYRREGIEAAYRFGFPLGPRGEWREGWTQGFGRNLSVQSFFMQRPGRPAHVLTSPILEYYLWQDEGEPWLGFPTSDAVAAPAGVHCQAFENGVLVASGEAGEVSYRVEPVGSRPCG